MSQERTADRKLNIQHYCQLVRKKTLGRGQGFFLEAGS